jgi:hypothetical protein
MNGGCWEAVIWGWGNAGRRQNAWRRQFHASPKTPVESIAWDYSPFLSPIASVVSQLFWQFFNESMPKKAEEYWKEQKNLPSLSSPDGKDNRD